jgi:tetratricopeptide (TPR) repeat protein
VGRRCGLVLVLAVALLELGAAPAFSQSGHVPVALTADQWRADLRYLAEAMPQRHKKLFHTMTPEAFHRAVEQLDADIPHLNDDEIALRLFTIATMPEDSHTGGLGYPPGTYFPLRLRHYEDGLYVESAPSKYADAVGGRLVRIGDASAVAVYEKLRAIVPHDPGNPGLLESIGPVLMMSGHVLHGFGVEPSADAATFVVNKNGKELRLDLAPEVPFETLYGHGPVAGWTDARGSAPAPLWLTHPDRPFWSMYLRAERTFYVQFNAVQNAKDQTVEQFFEDAFRQAGQLPVDKFVLDIRLNNGGNNYLLKPIIVGLIRMQSIDRPGHLFVVVSRSTYSAAQNLVNRLEQYTNAIFVGQPTGEHINSYGDPTAIRLPNSRITVGVASVWWQDNDERDKRVETDPEIAADQTFADYRANRDPAMDAIAVYRPERSLEEEVLAGVGSAGVNGGLAAYRAYASNPIHRYVRDRMEPKVNALGYKLLADGRMREAVAVFALNADANPKSANAADSLGEAYLAAGDRAKAIESYRHALQLDPKLATSRAALERLGVPAQ